MKNHLRCACAVLFAVLCGCAEEQERPSHHNSPSAIGGGSSQLEGLIPEFVTLPSTADDISKIPPAQHLDEHPAAAPVLPSTQSLFGANSRWAHGTVPLRHRPQTADTVFAQVGEGTQIEFVSTMTNESGAWSFVRTNSGPAWVPAAALSANP